jgi:hypothetical protein
MGWMDVATAETRRAFHVLGCTIRIHTAVASLYLLYYILSLFLYFSFHLHFIFGSEPNKRGYLRP